MYYKPSTHLDVVGYSDVDQPEIQLINVLLLTIVSLLMGHLEKKHIARFRVESK